MNAFSIFLLAVLMLTFEGCGEKVSDNKNEAAISAVTAIPALNTKELTPDEKLAKLQKEADAGNAIAQISLGEMYEKGKGTTKNETVAIDWYKRAAAQGNAIGQTKLGWWIFTNTGDREKALELLQQAAAQGEPVSQLRLGQFYSDSETYINGVSVKNKYKDVPKAMEWYLKAAAQGNAIAATNLGYYYEKGNGVKKDEAKSLEWYKKAFEIYKRNAEQGEADAERGLASAYFHGHGVAKDDDKAVEWQEKAAAQGGVDEQKSLAYNFYMGLGVPKNQVKAFEWFKMAAEQGDADSQIRLGNFYDEGVVVPKDNTRAFEWRLKAAAQGDSSGQFQVGYSYAKGDGVNQDIVRAYAWLNLSATQQNSELRNNTDAILTKLHSSIRERLRLTPVQLVEAQKLSSRWKKGDNLLVSGDGQSGSTSPNDKPRKQMTGTAFAVSSEGHALTNQHVINGCVEVRIAGREGIVKVITFDSVNDLALLQLPGNTKDIASLNPDPGKLRQGEDIIVFGYPLNSVLSSGGNLTLGTISALTGMGNNTNQIQITAPIQPGSSGSPVMDKKGNVMGVVSMKLSDSKMAKATGQIGQNVNFAVNGQTVKTFLDANKVPYKTGGGLFSREKSNADIAEEASKWTVLVECWK